MNSINISDLLNDVKKGSIVLPDFQRSFVWKPEDVRELLVSILGNYFIGSILLLEELKENSPFQLRLIEGVKEIEPNIDIQKTIKIVLDGQQRITALYYAFNNPPINLKGVKSPYKFYIDIKKALDKEYNEAVLAVNINDSNKLKQISDNRYVINISLLSKIKELVSRYKDDQQLEEIIEMANNFMNYSVNIVDLKNADTEKIVETFERINRTGKPLSIFDLLTARLYKYDIKLRDMWENIKKEYMFAKRIIPEFILKVMVLNRDEEIKRKNILNIKVQNQSKFKNDWYTACDYIDYAFKRITDIKHGYGVIDFKKWMPYSTMLIPLASMLGYIKSNRLDNATNYAKIDCWYWVSVFSNRYDQAADTTTYNDFKAVKNWIDNNIIPEFIKRFNSKDVDLDVCQKSAAIYRGIICLIVLKGALDFETGQPPQFNKKKIQDDHIFPKSKYNYNEITNRTLISTNSRKGNKEPQEYFNYCLQKLGKDKLLEILQTHLITAEALDYLLNNDLTNFINIRKKTIIDEINNRIIARDSLR